MDFLNNVNVFANSTVSGTILRACCARGSAATLALTRNTITTIVLNTMIVNSDSGLYSFNSNGIKISQSGFYMVSGSVYTAITTVANAAIGRSVYIFNGSTELFHSADYTYNTGTTGAIASGLKLISVNANDIIYLKVRSSNTAGTAYPPNSGTYLSIAKI